MRPVRPRRRRQLHADRTVRHGGRTAPAGPVPRRLRRRPRAVRGPVGGRRWGGRRGGVALRDGRSGRRAPFGRRPAAADGRPLPASRDADTLASLGRPAAAAAAAHEDGFVVADAHSK